MHAHFLTLVKTFIKSSLDNYILPGTLTGSEIMWLYASQWKRDVASIVLASYLLSTHMLRSRALNAFLSTDESESTDTQFPVESH